MITARLIDNIWATRKADSLTGYKLMLAEVIGGSDAGKRLVVVDIISAGIGDRVIRQLEECLEATMFLWMRLLLEL